MPTVLSFDLILNQSLKNIIQQIKRIQLFNQLQELQLTNITFVIRLFQRMVLLHHIRIL